jgi:hypothetical protein
MVFMTDLSWRIYAMLKPAFRQSGGKSVSDYAPSSCLRLAVDGCKTYDGSFANYD